MQATIEMHKLTLSLTAQISEASVKTTLKKVVYHERGHLSFEAHYEAV